VRDLDIAEVARRSGLPASTLRFYEEKGLIRSIGRRGLRRLFDPGVLEQLALITLGRSSGFSLHEIAEMFGSDGRARINREKLMSKADELERSIARLKTMRDGLRHAAHCPLPNQLDCPTFRRILAASTKRFRRQRSLPRGRVSLARWHVDEWTCNAVAGEVADFGELFRQSAKSNEGRSLTPQGG